MAYTASISFQAGGFLGRRSCDRAVIPFVLRQTVLLPAVFLGTGVPVLVGITAPQRAEDVLFLGNILCFGVIAFGAGKGSGARRIIRRLQRDLNVPGMNGLSGNLIAVRMICAGVPVFGVALAPIGAVGMACRANGFRLGLDRKSTRLNSSHIH